MTLSEIRSMPRDVDFKDVDPNSKGMHESCFRSYHIVEKVMELCHEATPHKLMLEIINDLRLAPEPNNKTQL